MNSTIPISSPAATFPQLLFPESTPPASRSPTSARGGAAAASICSGGRDMDCRETIENGGEVAVACPPDDSLVEIFSRLPAKPLFRFKCVSKDWCGLIADRLGCRKFPFPQTLQGFFCSSGVENYGDFIDLSGRPLPLVDPSFSFLTKLPEIEKIVLLDSCNGLVLLGHRRVSDKYDSLGYIVCNPATEEWVSVPSSGYTPVKWDDIDIDDEYKDIQDDGPDTYLIFDPAISPHFRLMQFRLGCRFDGKEVFTFSFSSVTGAWRFEFEGVPGLDPGMARVGTGAFAGCPFNGKLHVPEHSSYLPEGNEDMILAVGEGRTCSTLLWPIRDHGFLVFIGQSQGHLHCLSGRMRKDSQMTGLSIWVLEDYNAQKWVLRGNVSFSQLFGRISGRWYADWNVVSIHPDRGLVFFAEYWNHKLISYDMDKKEVCVLSSLHGSHWPIIPYVPYFAQSAVLAKKR